MQSTRPYRFSLAHRLSAVVVMLLFLYNAAGYTVVFTALRAAVRQEVKMLLKNGVPENELHELILPYHVEHDPQSGFQRIHEREFRYQGRMYDIVRQETRGDTTIYYCINDVEEELLFANLENHVSTHLPASAAAQHPSTRTALKLVIKDAMPVVRECTTAPYRHVIPPVCDEVHLYRFDNTDIPTPPPRSLVS